MWQTPIIPNFGELECQFFASSTLRLASQAGGVTLPYEQHVWVYACINAIDQSISGDPLLFKTGTRKDPKIVESHPLADLFNAPNPLMSGSPRPWENRCWSCER